MCGHKFAARYFLRSRAQLRLIFLGFQMMPVALLPAGSGV
jgi:hypothetical protein